MRLKTVLGGTTYQFKSVKEVMAKANEKKSGDEMAGLSAKSVSERIAAKEVLSELLVSDVRNNPAVPYEEDEVTRIIQDDCCDIMYGKIKNWSIAELREYLLSEKTTEEDINNFCKELPRYKRPRKIIFADVPRNPTGKIEKPKLRHMYNSENLVDAQNRA